MKQLNPYKPMGGKDIKKREERKGKREGGVEVLRRNSYPT